MTKTGLIQAVKRRLGCPVINVELDDSQISDHIDYARQKYIKWAVGNATQEYYFTVPLSAGVVLYDMPSGMVEISNYFAGGAGEGGINTLFTVDNYLWNQGYYDFLVKAEGTEWSLISYHIARDFLETLQKYNVDPYNYHYHPYTNQLEINPAPTISGSDPNPHILVRAWFIEGATPWSTGIVDLGYDGFAGEAQDIYSKGWMLDYVTALSKITLGYIRNKFANFTSLGNTGLQLDGDTLISEGKEEKEALEEALRLEEAYEGYGIEIGTM
jgi:hypothetical protein